MNTNSFGVLRVLRSAFVLGCLVIGPSLTPAHAGAFINILPIKICDDAGMNCANDAEELFLAATNKIWAQASIKFVYLPFTTTNSSTYLSLDNQAEVNALFADAPGAAGDPRTISMWFVDNHFDAFGEVNAIGGNKIVIDDGIFPANRLDTIAHEVGHLLGLKHDDPGVGMDFLMRSGLDRTTPTVIGDITPDGAELDKLTAAEIITAQSNPKVMPVPGVLLLFASGLGILMIGRGRRKEPRA